MLILAAFAVSCANSDSVTPTSNSITEGQGGPGMPPIYSVLEESLGVQLGALSQVINDAQVGWVADCVQERGFIVLDGDLPSNDPADSPAQSGGAVDLAIASLESRQTVDAAASTKEVDPLKSAAISSCLEASLEAVPNPLEEFQAWVAEELADVQAAVAADERVLQAREKETACIKRLGYENYYQLYNSFAEEAQSILDKEVDGVIATDAALAQLADLRKAEEAVGPDAQECSRDRVDAERSALVEGQNAFVEANSAAIQSELARLSPRFAKYVEEVKREVGQPSETPTPSS